MTGPAGGWDGDDAAPAEAVAWEEVAVEVELFAMVVILAF
jgi:hypothetical protein